MAVPTPSISTFSAVADLAVTSGRNAKGLCNDKDTLSGCGVEGVGLGGSPINIQASDGSGPTWSGTLPGSSDDGKASWVADLKCVYPDQGARVGARGDLGDPLDVDITIKIGPDVSKPVVQLPNAALPNKVTVKVGPGPTT
jgi:hypothetical protein